MVGIPQDTVTAVDLAQWFTLQQELAKLKASEMLLRQRIFKHYFPNAKEGTNTFVLPDGYQLKADLPYERKVDEGALQALSEELAKAMVSKDELLEYKPSLKVKEYRTLTDEQRLIVDQFLIIKPGTPSVKIVPPSTKAKAGDTANKQEKPQ